jgi:hypothetical protein
MVTEPRRDRSLADTLDKPVDFDLGNHREELNRLGERGEHDEPMGCDDLGSRIVRIPFTGMILVGLPGSPKYCDSGQAQYTEGEVMATILRIQEVATAWFYCTRTPIVHPAVLPAPGRAGRPSSSWRCASRWPPASPCWGPARR